MSNQTSIESAIDRLTDAIDDYAGVLKDIRATLEDILDAVVEGNEDRRKHEDEEEEDIFAPSKCECESCKAVR